MPLFSARALLASTSKWPTAVAVLILCTCAAFQLHVAQLPLPNLLEHALNDDTFYYLEIAHRSAQGQGSTFDGIHLTNGFQPAWKALLTLLASVVRDKEMLLRAALVFCTILNLGAGLLLFLSARLMLPPPVVLAPLLLWAAVQIDPHIALSGMETSLNWLMFSFVLWLLLKLATSSWLDWIGGPKHLWVWGAIIGMFSGLLFYCRIDNALYIVCTAVIVGLLQLSRSPDHKHTQSLKPAAIAALSVLGVASLIVAPYLISNSLTLGTPLPISGMAKQKMNYDLITASMGGYLSVETFIHSAARTSEKVAWAAAQLMRVLTDGEPLWLARPMIFLAGAIAVLAATITGVVGQLVTGRMVPKQTLVPIVKALYQACVVLVLLWLLYGIAGYLAQPAPLQTATKALIVLGALPVAYVRGMRCAEAQENQLGPRDLVMVLLLLAMVIHAFVLAYALDHFLDYTSWYYANWFIILALWGGMALHELLQPGKLLGLRRLIAYGGIAWLTIGFVVTVAQGVRTVVAPPRLPPYGVHAQFEVAQWLRANVPTDAIIASFNAGALGYFSERSTINLDGLANDKELIEYNYQRHNLTEYLDSECPDFVVDYLDDAFYSDGLMPAGDRIWGIDRSRLQPIKWFSAQGWQGRSQTFFVFRYDKSFCQL